jgi:uncharacterized protein YkwD
VIPTSTSAPLRRLAAAGLALALAGCATIEANRRVPGVLAAGTFTPSRPPAARLGLDPARTCPVGGTYQETYDKVEKGVAERGANPAVADGRLCGVAEAFLGWTDEAPPRDGVRAFVARHFGLVATPQVIINVLESDDTRQLGESVANVVIKFANQSTAARYGLAAERLAAKKTRVVIVLENARVALDPLPRRLELGEKATVSGTLLGDQENPKLVISDAKGAVSEPPQAPGKAFKGEVACGQTPGRIVVELHADDMGNEILAGTLVLACGGPPLPTSVAVAPPAWPDSVPEQEALVRKAIDAERAQAGLPALTWSEPVGKIARDVAEGLREGAKKGGVPPQVNLAQRLTDADIQAPLIVQNPAAGFSAEGASERLLQSPSHRANIMNADVTQGGVGVALGTDQAGKPMAYLVELFIKVQPPPDVAAAKQTIRAAIDKKRAAEKLPALTTDPGLEQLANDFAAVVASNGGPPPKAKTEEFTKSINKAYRDIVFMVDSRIDLDDFAEDPNVLAKGKLVGLGGALGRHPRLGKNTLFVVLVIANKQGAKK